MKQVLKLIFSTLLGACIGFGAMLLCITLFTDISIGEFFEKAGNIKIVTLLLSCLLSLVCLIIAVYLQIILHEGGHLILGLATGYRFVSFRVGSLTLIKEKGRYRFKRFSISGTGGQCLLSPPHKPYNQLPYFWYNAGGVLMNLLTGIAAFILWVMFPDMPMPLHLFLLIFFIVGFFLALMNGIPMKLSGITNDAYNLILMSKDTESRRSLAVQLYVNAEIQNGVRPKDMPEEWFRDIEIKDYCNLLHVNIKLLHAARLIDCMRFEEARAVLDELFLHRGEIVGVFVLEIGCELLFLELVGACRQENIESLYTEKLEKYVQRYKNLMSSKQRLLFAIALYRDRDILKAREIYEKLSANRDRYLLQGDVASDLDIMGRLLEKEEGAV